MELDGLRNLGPVSVRRLAAIGIETAAELEAIGAVSAYRQVKAAFPGETSLNLLYALEGAIIDVPWHDLPPALVERLRAAVQ